MKSKERVESFSHQTHIHGFRELFASSSSSAKLLWCSLIITALSITTYQVASTLAEYIREPTHTEVAYMNEDEMLYPPAAICHPHWATWVDFEKAKALNFTKNELFYAMTFIDNVIYSSELFNVSETENSFLKKLKSNNLKNLNEFFNKIRKFDNISSAFVKDQKPKVWLEPTSWQIEEMSLYRLCYLFKSEEIKKIIETYKREIQDLFYSKRVTENRMAEFTVSDVLLNQQNFDHWLTGEEKDAYVKEMIIRYGLDKSESQKHQNNLPLIVQPNIHVPDDFNLFPNREITIYLVANIFSWKSTKEKPCIEGQKRIGEDITCHSICFRNFSFDYEHYKNPTRMVPWKQTFFNTYSTINFFEHGNVSFNEEVKNVPNERLIELESKMKSCSENCDTQIGCDVLSYRLGSVHKAIAAAGTEKVYIIYPNSEQSIMFKQINVLTVETLFADVGGLLGIWTGASILTIFQMFYLCCCYTSGKESTSQTNSKNKEFNKTKASRRKCKISVDHM